MIRTLVLDLYFVVLLIYNGVLKISGKCVAFIIAEWIGVWNKADWSTIVYLKYTTAQHYSFTNLYLVFQILNTVAAYLKYKKALTVESCS